MKKYNVVIQGRSIEIVQDTDGKFIIPQEFRGIGTALKPSTEEWILVRKPLEHKLTVAANTLKHGTGGINIDISRIPGKLDGDPNRFSKAFSMGEGHEGWKRPSHENYTPPIVRSEGRFPANLVLSHNEDCEETCSHGCAVAELDKQSGNLSSGKPGVRRKNHDTTSMSGRLGLTGKTESGFGDSGGASRFFYCAKASKSDKGATNVHPTVKSTKLMSYLINMITPPGGLVLDPFLGSGTTGVSAVTLGYDFIGIEKDEGYLAIAEKRVNAAFNTKEEKDVA